MFRVLELQNNLPPGFAAFEGEELLMVVCYWCAYELVYWCGRVDLYRIQADALRHRVDCHDPDATD